MAMSDPAGATSAEELTLVSEGRSIGESIEEVVCNGSLATLKLSSADRSLVVEFAASFEECSSTTEELNAMADADLLRAAYWAMAEYARGQM
ncbi:hypothetical protein [Piscinibacter gummiphilus]|uniref:NIF system FeS cluster assembly NifU N-terminal domain-containing protein n=1 Tax=Piscinibacter gummiphilus TaxID=946333 RepID=A0ABZ0D6Z1_9BURK|nr:hypothetical protein [Piscinibacter gummiphilus]WOB11291.1 hypothetical protein RXV79_27045 [Piscinibacter gummiphilus]